MWALLWFSSFARCVFLELMCEFLFLFLSLFASTTTMTTPLSTVILHCVKYQQEHIEL